MPGVPGLKNNKYMCAIFGSNNLEEFKALYKHNACKGREGLGVLLMPGTWTSKPAVLKKFIGYPDLSKALSPEKTKDFAYFVGHSQTSNPAVPTPTRSLINPFVCGDWVVAHNGRLKNFERLKSEVTADKYNASDSSIIPALLEKYQFREKSQTDDILKVLSLLEGPCSLWVYNINSLKLYMVTNGVPVYMNPATSTFTTVPVRGMIPGRDGQLFQRADNPSSEMDGKWIFEGEIRARKHKETSVFRMSFKTNQPVTPRHLLENQPLPFVDARTPANP